MIRLTVKSVVVCGALIAVGCGSGSDPTVPAPVKTAAQPTAAKEKDKKYLTNSIGMKFVLIPKGKFLMGSPKGEAPLKEQDKETQHDVEITKAYFLGVYEVTQQQFEQIMGSNPSYLSPTGKGKNIVAAIDTKKLPVESVTWEEADEFCKKLAELDAEKAAGRVYQLPTEAEWEYACRAGANPQQAFNTGKIVTSSEANINRQLGRTREPGSYKPNAFGLYDMHGNVLEWTSDWLGPYPSESVADPTGPETGRYRIYRGGGWLSPIENSRSATRLAVTTKYRMIDTGIRVKLTSSEKP